MTSDNPDKDVAFGFRRVAEGDKQGLVNEVFAKAALRYDQMNDLMSVGLHRLWKDDLIAMLAPPRRATPFHVLDVAGGTGDIAFRIAARAAAKGEPAQVTICDINYDMLSHGVTRPEAKRDGIVWLCGDAENLPVKDASQDAYTIAFGIRNVPRVEKALAEAYRVLKRGGRFLCLEFSGVDVPVLDRLYDAYSFTAIPAIGKVVTGDGAPYRYLVESIRKFPRAEDFRAMIEDAGFRRASFTRLTGGVVAIHSGWKL